MAEDAATGKQAFLADLGVRAEDTSQVEHKVLQKVRYKRFASPTDCDRQTPQKSYKCAGGGASKEHC